MLGRVFSQLALKIGALVRGGRDADVADEIQAHIDQLEELYRSEGMSPVQARNAARRKFGNHVVIRETGRPCRSDDRLEVRVAGRAAYQWPDWVPNLCSLYYHACLEPGRQHR